MISLSIKDTKSFMSHLLIKDTFDNWLINSANIHTANTFTIDGNINKSFYTSDELSDITENYSYWKAVKPVCFSLIKGNKVPTSMKYVFSLDKSATNDILQNCKCEIMQEDINGLFINLKYLDDKVTIVTGTSIKVFTLDKTLEKAFDNYICDFLDNLCISYEESNDFINF